MRLYLTELVELTESTLQSQSWLMKAQAAAAMSTIATKLDASLGPPHLGLLLTALTNGLAGRTWAGKVGPSTLSSHRLFTRLEGLNHKQRFGAELFIQRPA